MGSRGSLGTEVDAVWSFAGVRPLFDDDAGDASAMSRDYVLDLQDHGGELPVLSILGGKLTTYRRLAERVLDRLKPFFPDMGNAWTATEPLPGGDMDGGDVQRFLSALGNDYPGLDCKWLRDLTRRHGTRMRDILGVAENPDGLGRDFGAGLYQREIEYLIDREWAETADDVLWRRTKCGLAMTDGERQAVAGYMKSLKSAKRSG